jgi:hypothetical protein
VKKISAQKGRAEIEKAFRAAINMSAPEIVKWLATNRSTSVGWIPTGQKESIGHRSGRRIVAIQRKKKSERTEMDYRHMRKVVGYVRRHLAQRPGEDVMHTRWRYSLMNWGHDPMKD